MITLKAEDLRERLPALNATVNVRSDQEEFGGVLVRPAKNHVRILGTDMIGFAWVGVPARVKKGTPSFLIPYREFRDFAAFWSGDIHLTTKRNCVIMVSSGDKLELPRYQAEEDFYALFPNPKPNKPVLIRDLPYALNISYGAANPDHEKEALSGVHIQYESGEATVEAADGFKLASVKIEGSQNHKLNTIVKKKAGDIINYLPSPGVMWVRDSHFYYNCDYGTFAILTVNAEHYPDLDAIQRPMKGRALISKKDLENLIKKAGIIGSTRVLLRQVGPHKIRTEAVSVDGGRNHKGNISGNISGKVPKISVGVDHLNYLHAIAPNDKLALRFGTSKTPLWFQEGGITFLSMPFDIGGQSG